MTRRAVIAALTFAIAVAGCSLTDSSPSTSTTLPPISTTLPPSIWSFDRGPDDLVLELTFTGGLRPDFVYLSALPIWSIFGDGSLLAPDPWQDDRILQPVKQLQISATDLETINELVGAMGLRNIDVLHDGSAEGEVIDAATTVATYWDENGGQHEYSVYALHSGSGFDIGAGSLAALSRLFSREDIAAAPTFQPDRVQLYVASGADRSDPANWPLDVVPSDFTGIAGDYACLSLVGEQADTAAEALMGPPRGQAFESDGRFYQILARFLLPGHDGCGPVFGEDVDS